MEKPVEDIFTLHYITKQFWVKISKKYWFQNYKDPSYLKLIGSSFLATIKSYDNVYFSSVMELGYKKVARNIMHVVHLWKVTPIFCTHGLVNETGLEL